MQLLIEGFTKPFNTGTFTRSHNGLLHLHILIDTRSYDLLEI